MDSDGWLDKIDGFSVHIAYVCSNLCIYCVLVWARSTPFNIMAGDATLQLRQYQEIPLKGVSYNFFNVFFDLPCADLCALHLIIKLLGNKM